MAGSVRITRHLDSDTIPSCKRLVGHDVEITVPELSHVPAADARYPLRGSVLRYDDPFEPVAESL